MGIESGSLGQNLQYGGSALAAVSAYNASVASRAAYNAQAQIASNNAQLALDQSADAIRRGQVAASNEGIKTNQVKGAQRAAMAANGVDLGVGSAQNILTDTDYYGQIDKNTIIDNAAREAWGYRVQMTNFTNNADLLRTRAENENPFMAGATSLLTNAGRVSNSWYTTKRVS